MKAISKRDLGQSIEKLTKAVAKDGETRIGDSDLVLSLRPRQAPPSLRWFRKKMKKMRVPSQVLVREDRDSRE